MWIYLECSMDSTSSAESGESLSPLTNGCGHVFIANWMPTAKVCFCPECKKEILIEHQYGMTSKPLEQESRNSPKRLISSSAGSRDYARTSVLQGLEKAWQESEADYFTRSCAWPKKSNQLLFSLKTQKGSCITEGLKSSKVLPPSGMQQDGLLRTVKRLVHHKIGKDGFVWPTVIASQAAKPIRAPSPSCVKKEHGYNLQDKIGERYPELIGKKINPLFLEWIMGFPLNWTELSPWAIPYVSSKSKKRLKS